MSENDLNPWLRWYPKVLLEENCQTQLLIHQGKELVVSSFIMNPFMETWNVINKYNMENFEENYGRIVVFLPKIGIHQTRSCIESCRRFYLSTRQRKITRHVFKSITASLDNRKNADLHPSFSTILKDFSPKDAILFKEFHEFNRNSVSCNQISIFRKKSGINIHENILLIDGRTIIEPIALNNLNRFGLVEIVSGIYLSSTQNSLRYQQFEESPFTLTKKQNYLSIPGEFSLDDIAVNKGKVEITSLGNYSEKQLFLNCLFNQLEHSRLNLSNLIRSYFSCFSHNHRIDGCRGTTEIAITMIEQIKISIVSLLKLKRTSLC